jgi:hypothetical protein
MMPLIALERFGPRNNPRATGVKGAMKRLVGTLGVLAFFAIGAIGAIRVWNMAGSTYDAMTFPSHIAAGLTPHLKSSDAYRITIDYLNAQTPELASPNLHQAPHMTAIWAVTANQAAALDGCIPMGKGNGIVWVTQGSGDYLNLANHAWSSAFSGNETHPCSGPGPAGTLVIDDATGQILGVYPYGGPTLPHPSPQITLAPSSGPSLSSPSTSPSGSASPGASASPVSSSKPGSSGSPKPSGSTKPGASGSPKPTASGG